MTAGDAGRRGDPRRDAGSATVELAVALPAVIVVLALVLTVVGVGIGRLTVQDAARIGTRLAITGADDAAVRGAVERAAGSRVHMTVSRSGGWVTVRVSRGVLFGLGGTAGGPVTVDGSHTGLLEAAAMSADPGGQ